MDIGGELDLDAAGDIAFMDGVRAGFIVDDADEIAGGCAADIDAIDSASQGDGCAVI